MQSCSLTGTEPSEPQFEVAEGSDAKITTDGDTKILYNVPAGATTEDVAAMLKPVQGGTLEFMEATGGSIDEGSTLVSGYIVILRVNGTEEDRMSVALLGDINPDGAVNGSDVELVRQSIVATRLGAGGNALRRYERRRRHGCARSVPD